MKPKGPLLLAGGGHSHALLLKRWAMQPQLRPDRMVVLINRYSTALYSGMVPSLIAGLVQHHDLAIDLRQLCERAGIAFLAAEIQGLDPDQQLLHLPREFKNFIAAVPSVHIGTGDVASIKYDKFERLINDDLRGVSLKLFKFTFFFIIKIIYNFLSFLTKI